MERYDTDDITKALFFAARGGYLGIVEFIFEKCISQSRRDDNFSLKWGEVFQQAIDEGLPNIFEVINSQCTGGMTVVLPVCVCLSVTTKFTAYHRLGLFLIRCC